jgi:ABC-2 type transport system ATP-binding protein
MLLGLVRPTAGQVRLFGAPPGPGQLTHVGALVEGPAFYPYLSGRDNLRTFAAHADVRRSRVDEVLETVELSARARDRYATYSLGMKQRLGLAAALLKNPSLLILDEPTNGLDPAGMADMRVTIRSLASQGCTILLSSHLLAEVQQVCDRVGVIANGRLVAEMTVEDMSAGGSLWIGVDRPREAVHIVSGLVGEGRVRPVPSANGSACGLDVDVDPERAGHLNTALVRAGFVVSELSWQAPDLEAMFLDLTGDHSDVA